MSAHTEGGAILLIENLQVGRIVMHEIFRRGEDRQKVPPSYGTELERLSDLAIGQFRARITDALSARSKSMEMRIVRQGQGSVVEAAGGLLASQDDEFLQRSKEIADLLAEAQMARSYPGGMVLVFDGTFGAPEQKFLGIIKAETQSGFRRSKSAEAMVTEFLENIFLTPATRLFKVAFLVQPDAVQADASWRALVFDSNITASHREGAAQYFYEAFLGCTFPENGKYETVKFYDLTREFVRQAQISPEAKRDLGDALYTFVKTEQSPTFTAQEFSESYLPLELRDPFSRFLNAKQFPDRAVVRDTSDMGARLRRRRFKFGADIELMASPQALQEGTATINEGPATVFGGDGEEVWTQITIKRPMTDQT